MATILSSNLKSITDHMKDNADVFERAVTYPSTNFPGRTQENLLGQLLRKKLEPGVERWVDEGEAMHRNTDGMDGLEAQWRVAGTSIKAMVARAAFAHRDDPYTAEERQTGIENVRTGLLKPMKIPGEEDDDEESEDEDADEDGDQEMKDVGAAEEGKGGRTAENGIEKKITGPVRTLDEIARFGVTGLTPEDEPPVTSAAFRR